MLLTEYMYIFYSFCVSVFTFVLLSYREINIYVESNTNMNADTQKEKKIYIYSVRIIHSHI